MVSFLEEWHELCSFGSLGRTVFPQDLWGDTSSCLRGGFNVSVDVLRAYSLQGSCKELLLKSKISNSPLNAQSSTLQQRYPLWIQRGRSLEIMFLMKESQKNKVLNQRSLNIMDLRVIISFTTALISSPFHLETLCILLILVAQQSSWEPLTMALQTILRSLLANLYLLLHTQWDTRI